MSQLVGPWGPWRHYHLRGHSLTLAGSHLVCSCGKAWPVTHIKENP